MCQGAGADDVGFVPLDRSELADQRTDIAAALPGAQALISIVCRTNVEAARSPARSVSNTEFHRRNHDTDDVARRIVAALERRGVRTPIPVDSPTDMGPLHGQGLAGQPPTGPQRTLSTRRAALRGCRALGAADSRWDRAERSSATEPRQAPRRRDLGGATGVMRVGRCSAVRLVGARGLGYRTGR